MSELEGFETYEVEYQDDPDLPVEPVEHVVPDEPVPPPEPEPGQDLPPTFDRESDEPVAGNPEAEMELWHQQEQPDTCAIASQEFVLEALTDQEFDEADLAREAEANGWYEPGGGTPMWSMDSLLESHGIPTETHFNASVDDITDALNDGNKILVSVDADEIWQQGADPALDDYTGDPIPGQDANHAVEVTGIVERAGATMVVLNDPGSSTGAGEMVPIEEFQSAWADSGHYMVVAGPTADDSVEAWGTAAAVTAAVPSVGSMADATGSWGETGSGHSLNWSHTEGYTDAKTGESVRWYGGDGKYYAT